MTAEIVGYVAIVVVMALCTGLVWMTRRKSFAKPIVVEEYRLNLVKDEGGFQKVVMRFQDAKGTVYPFEFHPAYAHHLSDELVTYAAKALKPSRAEASPPPRAPSN